MPVRPRNPRQKIVALVSFFALQAGLAAGPMRAGAETGSVSRPVAKAAPARPAARPAAQTPADAGAKAPPASDSLAADEAAAAPGVSAATSAASAPAAASPAPAPAYAAAPAPATAADLVPAERLHLKPVLVQAAHDSGLPTELVLAQAWAESSWRVDAVSGIGALGVLQLTPDTVDFVSKNLLHLDHELNVLDPADNARMGTVYLKHLLEHTDGDLRQALIAYNQGLRGLYRDGPDPDAVSYADTVLALRPVFAAGP